ncbi:MAG: SIMPL domain-containing protein [Dehalococcoidales bacterium]|nr:SIMPL domain-containing protein [Dehalococcoidales bacterium]
MKRTWLAVVGILLVVVVAALTACSGETSIAGPANLKVDLGSQQEGIFVNGTGKVAAAPDIATLSLGIEAQETSVADAQTKAAAAMEKVIAALKNGGIATKDIQTQYFNIQKVTRWDDKQQLEVVLGYKVTNIVTARIRTMDKVGTIIDAVAAAGGDLTRINSVSFSIEDPTDYQKDARARAMADAQAKAKQLADLSGIKLGKPSYISESTYTPAPIYRDTKMAVPAASQGVETSINAGELDVVVNVQVTYAIAE